MVNIKGLDLNLLVVFEVLFSEGNATRAATRLGLSQPAVSHALKRLREQLGDPLFVRAVRGLVPTPKAEALHRPVREFLQGLERSLGVREDFDPARAEDSFRVATTDYFEQVAVPGLLARLEREGPGTTLLCRPAGGRLPKEELEEGKVDLAIAGFFGELPERYYQQELFKDDFVGVVARKHPRLKTKVSLDAFAREKHVLISLGGDLTSRASAALAQKGHRMQYLAAVSSFSAPGWIVSSSELVLTCPRRLAETFEAHLPVRHFELPFKIPGIRVVQVWHERTHRDPAHKWFRALVAQSLKV
jgi:DNA-binding transcriptional LysR family regulator